MKSMTDFLHILKRVALALVLVLMVQQTMVPAPAAAGIPTTNTTETAAISKSWAQKLVEYLKSISWLNTIISTLTSFYDMLSDAFDDLINNTMVTNILQVISKILTMESEIRYTDAQIHAQWATKRASTQAAFVAEHALPPHQELCKSIMIGQLVTTTEDFEREVSRAITEAVSNRGRCPGCNENGGDRASTLLQQRLKYMNELDGVTPSPYATSQKSASGETLVDADLRGVRNSDVFVMPPFVSQLYTDETTKQQWVVRALEPNPKTYEEKSFNAKVDELFIMAGARPTPLMSAQLFTEKGMMQRALFNHCAANENILIKQCADEIAYHTRPNIDDPASQTLITAQNARCEAISGTIDKTAFGDCKKGLSSFETQYLTLLWCNSIQHAAGMKMARGTEDEIKRASELCSMGWTAWKSLVNRKKMNCVNAKQALSTTRQCWAAADAAGLGRQADLLKNPEYLARWSTEKQKRGLDVPAYLLDVKATKLKKKAPEGTPVDFDEIELPAAVGQ